MDFIGMTAYPLWNNESISLANASFMGSLNGLKERAGKTEIWIAETGWPFSGLTRGNNAVAGREQMQQYWSELGCLIFGKYNTWWFQLEDDSKEKYNWGFHDRFTGELRIKELSCPEFTCPIDQEPPAVSSVTLPTYSPAAIGSPAVPNPNISSLAASSLLSSASSLATSTLYRPVTPISALETSTIYETTTMYLTIARTVTQDSSPSNPAPDSTTQAPSQNRQYPLLVYNRLSHRRRRIIQRPIRLRYHEPRRGRAVRTCATFHRASI
jgi:glucan endo-1,3-beta-D-glucosidase